MPLTTDGIPSPHEEEVPLEIKLRATWAYRCCKDIMIDCAEERPQNVNIGELLASRKSMPTHLGVSPLTATSNSGNSANTIDFAGTSQDKSLGDRVSAALKTNYQK